MSSSSCKNRLKELTMLWLYVLTAALAIAFRYQLGITASCLYFGKQLSGQPAGTGFQNSLTPPISTNISILVWLIGAFVIGTMFWFYGIYHGLGAVALFIFVSILAGALLIPAPNSDHFLKLIYNSMANRHANFVKSNDTVRALAASHLVERMQNLYDHRLK